MFANYGKMRILFFHTNFRAYGIAQKCTISVFLYEKFMTSFFSQLGFVTRKFSQISQIANT